MYSDNLSTEAFLWKFQTPGTFFVYGALFLLLLIASPFYAWGIHDLMEKFAPESKTRNSFSFGDELVIITGIFLALAAYNDIAKQMRKMARLTRAVSECETLVDQFSTATLGLLSQSKRSVTVPIQRFDGTTSNVLSTICVSDCATMIIMCPVFLLFEAIRRGRTNKEEVRGIVMNFSPPQGSQTYASHAQLSETVLSFSEYTPVSSGIMTVFSARVLLLEQSKVFNEGMGALCASIANSSVRAAINEFENSRIETGWWVISLVYTIIGVLYLFVAPFLLWFGQGWFMLYTYPVVFLLVGGLTSYRWFIGDVIIYPREQFIRPVYERIISIAKKCDRLTLSQNNFYANSTKKLNIT